MTVWDFVFSIPLLMCVPLLVSLYLKGDRFPARFRQRVVIYGLVWFVYGLILRNFINENIVGMGQWDEAGHVEIGLTLSQSMAGGDWSTLWERAHHGNEAFQLLLGLFYYFTGGTGALSSAVIGLMCFWGGLATLNMISRRSPQWLQARKWDIFIVFLPSAIFWGTATLKEGLMYWSICMMFPFVQGTRLAQSAFSVVPAGAGMVLGTILRPYTAVIWVMTIILVATVNTRPILGVVLGIAAVPAAMVALKEQTNADIEAEEILARAEAQASSLRGVEEAGSTIGEGAIGGTMFLSGFVNLFFRPFPWKVRNVRTLLTSLEIWTIVIIMARSWRRLTTREKWQILKMPEIQASIIACVMFSFLFTYLPNEGIVARARLQAMPALIMLAVIPAWKVREKRMVSHKGMGSTLLVPPPAAARQPLDLRHRPTNKPRKSPLGN